MNQPVTTRIIIPGPPGEPRVARALFGEDIKTGSMPLEGYALAKQRITPESILIDGGLQQAWEGHAFPGAFTLVPQEGTVTEVNYVEVSDPDQLDKVNRRIGYWNYHEEGWYRRVKIVTPDRIKTEIELLTEDNPGNLEVITGSHPKGYEASIDEMERQARTEFATKVQEGKQHRELSLPDEKTNEIPPKSREGKH